MEHCFVRRIFMPVDDEKIKAALDDFEDDNFLDAKEKLAKEIAKARDEFLEKALELKNKLNPEPEEDEEETEEPEDDPEDEDEDPEDEDKEKEERRKRVQKSLKKKEKEDEE